jgi:hypothetical protein
VKKPSNTTYIFVSDFGLLSKSRERKEGRVELRNRRKDVSIAGVKQAMLQREGGGGGDSGSMSSSRSVLIDVGSVSSPKSVFIDV